MGDRPILFSGVMVRALLDGRKTQTRRVLAHGSTGEPPSQSPRFAVGDRLWVREAWRCNGWATDLATIFYRASESDGYSAMSEQYAVAAKQPLRVTGTWRPGIHLPRWASRITLTVTEVRVQRLQDLSEEDAAAEGCIKLKATGRAVEYRGGQYLGACWPSCRAWYRELWNSLNEDRGFGWDTNPFVATVSFSVARRNIDAGEAA